MTMKNYFQQAPEGLEDGEVRMSPGTQQPGDPRGGPPGKPQALGII